MKIYTKNELITKLLGLNDIGWVPNGRFGNHGGVGNTLEDYLGIEENNLPIPNASEWELKAQRSNTTSLTTLFHMEPSPTAMKFVPQVLLPLYGWSHQKAGNKYPKSERSFRQTINGLQRSDRGFGVEINRTQKKVLISFDASVVSPNHKDWLNQVNKNVGLGEINPQPYWGFTDLEYKAGSKLHNCFYVQADVKKVNGEEYYWYNKVSMLSRFSFNNFLRGLEEGWVLVDFDARTGHNHGTKFRLRQNYIQQLYSENKLLSG